jgi:hypothetical protein
MSTSGHPDAPFRAPLKRLPAACVLSMSAVCAACSGGTTTSPSRPSTLSTTSTPLPTPASTSTISFSEPSAMPCPGLRPPSPSCAFTAYVESGPSMGRFGSWRRADLLSISSRLICMRVRLRSPIPSPVQGTAPRCSRLSIALTNAAAPCCSNPMGLDTIVLGSVANAPLPVPSPTATPLVTPTRVMELSGNLAFRNVEVAHGAR